MTNEPKFNRVSRSVNKPLTVWGVERKLFFLAAIVGAATFNMFASLLSGLVMFLALYFLARWATKVDPQLLRILLNSTKFKREYDAAQRTSPRILMVITHDLGR